MGLHVPFKPLKNFIFSPLFPLNKCPLIAEISLIHGLKIIAKVLEPCGLEMNNYVLLFLKTPGKGKPSSH